MSNTLKLFLVMGLIAFYVVSKQILSVNQNTNTEIQTTILTEVAPSSENTKKVIDAPIVTQKVKDSADKTLSITNAEIELQEKIRKNEEINQKDLISQSQNNKSVTKKNLQQAQLQKIRLENIKNKNDLLLHEKIKELRTKNPRFIPPK